jgi:hypothetical protein
MFWLSSACRQPLFSSLMSKVNGMRDFKRETHTLNCGISIFFITKGSCLTPLSCNSTFTRNESFWLALIAAIFFSFVNICLASLFLSNFWGLYASNVSFIKRIQLNFIKRIQLNFNSLFYDSLSLLTSLNWTIYLRWLYIWNYIFHLKFFFNF